MSSSEIYILKLFLQGLSGLFAIGAAVLAYVDVSWDEEDPERKEDKRARLHTWFLDAGEQRRVRSVHLTRENRL